MHQELTDHIKNITCLDTLPTKRDAAGFLNMLLSSQLPVTRPRQMQLPVESGVYGLFYKNELVYLGETHAIASRVLNHITVGQKEFDGVSYLLAPADHREVIERRMIQALKPKYNRKHISRKTWGRVIIDDLAAVLDIPPGVIRQVCRDNGIIIDFQSVEIREVLFHLARLSNTKIFTNGAK